MKQIIIIIIYCVVEIRLCLWVDMFELLAKQERHNENIW